MCCCRHLHSRSLRYTVCLTSFLVCYTRFPQGIHFFSAPKPFLHNIQHLATKAGLILLPTLWILVLVCKVFDPVSFTPQKINPIWMAQCYTLCTNWLIALKKGIHSGNLSGSPQFIISGVFHIYVSNIMYLFYIYINTAYLCSICIYMQYIHNFTITYLDA